MPEFASITRLANLVSGSGFHFRVTDGSISAASSAGDFNGDGFADIAIGSDGFDGTGKTFVLFGATGEFLTNYGLASLDPQQGVQINGVNDYDCFGAAVAGVGDINRDGYGDILIGAFNAHAREQFRTGESYVVFGVPGETATAINSATLDGDNGFRLGGIDELDMSGWSVAGIGDVNGDGIADLLIGAPGADVNGVSGAGEAYVIFGRPKGFPAQVDLADIDGRNGFRLDGNSEFDFLGTRVAAAGDFNGDGFNDLIIGNYNGDPRGIKGAGVSYVVFGCGSNFPASIELASLNGSNGFRIEGIGAGDWSGYDVSSAGDINADG